MKKLKNGDIKEILIKNWMTHDGMWFFYCFQECGIEKTNKINKAAIRAMAKIEIERIKKALGVREINSIEELNNLFDEMFHIVKAEFMNFSYSFSAEENGQGILNFEMNQCFAHDGVKRIGIIDKYECGIFERIDGWFKGLDLKFDVSPQIKDCLIHKGEKCQRQYKFIFEK